MAIESTWIAFGGTVFGGVGLKVVEHWLGRNKIKVDDAQQIRNELRLEITSQREEIRELEAEVKNWRDQYYEVLQKYMIQNTELTLALHKIKEEALQAEKKAESIGQLPPHDSVLDNPAAH